MPSPLTNQNPKEGETQMGQQESSNMFNQENAANSGANPVTAPQPTKTHFSLPKGWIGQEQQSKTIEKAKASLQDFFVGKGESINFQILDSEPVYLPSHTVQTVSQKGYTLYNTFVCQTHNLPEMAQEYCIACQKSIKTTNQYYLRVYDPRGKYEEKKFSGVPTVKLWKPNFGVVTALREISEKFAKLKNLQLNELVFTMSRNEAGTTLTRAVDDMNGGFIAPFVLSQPILDVMKKPITDTIPFKKDSDLIILGI